jgi:hypothetical protein
MIENACPAGTTYGGVRKRGREVVRGRGGKWKLSYDI